MEKVCHDNPKVLHFYARHCWCNTRYWLVHLKTKKQLLFILVQIVKSSLEEVKLLPCIPWWNIEEAWSCSAPLILTAVSSNLSLIRNGISRQYWLDRSMAGFKASLDVSEKEENSLGPSWELNIVSCRLQSGHYTELSHIFTNKAW